MKKKAKKKSAFRKRRSIEEVWMYLDINKKDRKFFEFMAKASREGRL